MVPTYKRSPTSAGVAPTWPSSSTLLTSVPLVVSMTCKALSQPATKVRLLMMAGDPMTGPPGTLKVHSGLPPLSLSRQYSIWSPEPNSTLLPSKLAAEVISASVSKTHFFSPDLASTQWNLPSSSPAYTRPALTATPTLMGAPALYFHLG